MMWALKSARLLLTGVHSRLRFRINEIRVKLRRGLLQPGLREGVCDHDTLCMPLARNKAHVLLL